MPEYQNDDISVISLRRTLTAMKLLHPAFPRDRSGKGLPEGKPIVNGLPCRHMPEGSRTHDAGKGSMTMTDGMRAVFDYIDAHREEFIERLRALLKQPSVAAQSLGIAETAGMVAEAINALGLGHADLLPTGGSPVVFARLEGTGPRILNFYNHYDVQPAEPLDLWRSDPWGAEIRDGKLYARGVADNKGNMIARICAIEALKAVRGSLPCTVQFFVEGEEEIGSIHLHIFVEEHAHLIPADGCIWEFGGKDASERLTMSLGLRGICYVEMRCTGANTDLHSSVANGVINPAWRLIWALATIKAPDGRVLIPGFYDEVLPPPPEAVIVLEEMPRQYPRYNLASWRWRCNKPVPRSIAIDCGGSLGEVARSERLQMDSGRLSRSERPLDDGISTGRRVGRT
jgi:hypothetical protein